VLKPRPRHKTAMALGISVILLSACASAAPSPSITPSPSTSASTGPAASSVSAVGSSTPNPSVASGSPVAAAKPGASAFSNTPAGPKVRIRLGATSVPTLALQVAADAKLYEKNGMNPDAQPFTGAASALIAAVVSNEIDIGQVGTEGVLGAIAHGAPLVFVGALMPEMYGIEMAGPDIKQVTDLKGKTILISGFGNAEHFKTRKAIALGGLDPDKDVTYRSIQEPGLAGRLAAVTSGQAAALQANPPDDLVAEKAGLHALVDLSQLHVPYPGSSLFVTKSYLAAHRATVLQFLRATTEAIALVQKDPAQGASSVLKWTKSDDRVAAQHSVDWFKSSAPKLPAMTLDGLKNVQDVVAAQDPEASKLDLATILDTSLTDELQKSGFVDQVNAH